MLYHLQIRKKSVPLQCVFHSIRFKVNKGWSKALLLFLCPYGSFYIYQQFDEQKLVIYQQFIKLKSCNYQQFKMQKLVIYQQFIKLITIFAACNQSVNDMDIRLIERIVLDQKEDLDEMRATEWCHRPHKNN